MFPFIFNPYLFLYYSYRDFNVQISFSNMKILILDNNMISSVDNFPSIPSLQTLSLSNNNINNLSSFINSVKMKFPLLTSLNTFKNPMNPGMMNPGNYNQYKTYIKKIGSIYELDGMNINDTSYMNQGQQNSQPKRDLFGTSGNATMTTTNPPQKINFFDNNQTTNSTPQNFNSANTPMNQNQPQNQKMNMFNDVQEYYQKPLNKNNMMFTNLTQFNNNDTNVNNGQVFHRQYFIIDESEELDGTEFVNSKKKKSTVMINEKIFKKSDNMTNFNRKNRSEGNKHILNQEL